MKNYGRFFNERNEKHKLTAVILLTAGIITFVAVLHTVRVIIRESGGALERDAQIVASLFSLCGIILLTALILFFVWNVRIAAKFEICRMGAELDREKIANQAKSDFLSGMSHELRTPMNAIVGLTTLARRSVGDEQKTTMYLRKLEISTSYMLSLINDILEMSRIERGKMTLYQIPCDFYEVVEAVDAMMCQISGEKQQHFEMDIRVEHHQIIGDKVRLQQIIINLLNNAVKHTGTGGRIRLEIEERKMEDGKVWLYVEVSDTGIGIRPEDQERIFEPFEEAEGKERGGAFAAGGTGLGLSICRDLLRRMGSEIHVQSVPNQGSVFSFEAAFECAESELFPEDEIPQGTWDLSGRRFLVAEDNEMNRNMLIDLLMDEGVECDPAEDGLEALQMFEKSKPGTYDAVLMDIQMPRMDGLKATSKIRTSAHADAAVVPVVAMSAYAFTEDIEKSRQAGMDEYITKPINIVELCKLLNHLIALHAKGA